MEKFIMLIASLKLGEWCPTPSGSPSFFLLKSLLLAARLSIFFWHSCFLLASKNKRTPCRSFKLQSCKCNFSLESSEELQRLQKTKLLNLLCCTVWCTQSPNNLDGCWDMSENPFLSCYSNLEKLVDLL